MVLFVLKRFKRDYAWLKRVFLHNADFVTVHAFDYRSVLRYETAIGGLTIIPEPASNILVLELCRGRENVSSS